MRQRWWIHHRHWPQGRRRQGCLLLLCYYLYRPPPPSSAERYSADAQAQDIPMMGIPLNGFIICRLAIDVHGNCPNAIFDSKGWCICDKLGQLMHPTDSLRGDFGIPVEFDKVGEEEGLKRGCTGWLMRCGEGPRLALGCSRSLFSFFRKNCC